MKKAFLSLGLVFLATGVLFAQDKKKAENTVNPHAAPATKADDHAGHAHGNAAAAPTPAQPDVMVFNKDSHDFGTIPEGPAADYEFTFKNTGKKPIVIQRVQPSCGCTTPSYSKEPIAPGKSGTVKASYGTQGRPGSFNKTLTVFYNVGDDTNPQTKVLTINGNVEKAPTSSVPENNSMIKTN